MALLQLFATSKFSVFGLSPQSDSISNAHEECEKVLLPFTDLTSFISNGSIENLGYYLADQSLFPSEGVDTSDFDRTVFAAAGRKHADEIKLQDRCGYGDDKAWPETFDFHDCRKLRGSAEHWRHNANADKLPGLVAFVDDLPFFKETGKVTIILSPAGVDGVEHVDHKFEDLVSEFVWLRTGVGPSKQLFVRDANGDKRYVKKLQRTQMAQRIAIAGDHDVVVGENVQTEELSHELGNKDDDGGDGLCVWFDDHHAHCTDALHQAAYSIRVDGVFNDEFREYICAVGVFASAGLRGVFRRAGGKSTNKSSDNHCVNDDQNGKNDNRDSDVHAPLSKAAALSSQRAKAKAHLACALQKFSPSLPSPIFAD